MVGAVLLTSISVGAALGVLVALVAERRKLQFIAALGFALFGLAVLLIEFAFFARFAW
ncbi:MAG: hypothetical protein AAF707_01580 [Pseudomonadota bacterium]